jgi:hypothetical protein
VACPRTESLSLSAVRSGGWCRRRCDAPRATVPAVHRFCTPPESRIFSFGKQPVVLLASPISQLFCTTSQHMRGETQLILPCPILLQRALSSAVPLTSIPSLVLSAPILDYRRLIPDGWKLKHSHIGGESSIASCYHPRSGKRSIW